MNGSDRTRLVFAHSSRLPSSPNLVLRRRPFHDRSRDRTAHRRPAVVGRAGRWACALVLASQLIGLGALLPCRSPPGGLGLVAAPRRAGRADRASPAARRRAAGGLEPDGGPGHIAVKVLRRPAVAAAARAPGRLHRLRDPGQGRRGCLAGRLGAGCPAAAGGLSAKPGPARPPISPPARRCSPPVQGWAAPWRCAASRRRPASPPWPTIRPSSSALADALPVTTLALIARAASRRGWGRLAPPLAVGLRPGPRWLRPAQARPARAQGRPGLGAARWPRRSPSSPRWR